MGTTADIELIIVLVLCIVSVIPTLWGWIIGRQKGHPWGGLFLGLFFSWIGVLIISLISPTAEAAKRRALRHDSRLCPNCQQVISRKAMVCPFCQRHLVSTDTFQADTLVDSQSLEKNVANEASSKRVNGIRVTKWVVEGLAAVLLAVVLSHQIQFYRAKAAFATHSPTRTSLIHKQMAAKQFLQWEKAGVPIKNFGQQLSGNQVTGLNVRTGNGAFTPNASVLQKLTVSHTTWWILAFRHPGILGSINGPNDIALFRNSRLVWTFPSKQSYGWMQLWNGNIPSKALTMINPDVIQLRFCNITLGGSGGTTVTLVDHWNIKTKRMTNVSHKSSLF